MAKTVKLHCDEAKEIAGVITKTENPDEDYSITENALAKKWGIYMDTFHEIADGIFKMIDFGISPLTQTPFVGISKDSMWLAKKEVNQQFIHAIINWATEGEDIPEGSKGFVRTITSGGKPEFDITISRPASCQTALSCWVAFDWNKIETRPKKYGKYLICRKDGKIHWENWNGSGWAYNHNEIRFWAIVVPPF